MEKRVRKSTMVEFVDELEKLQRFFEKPSPIDFLISEAKAGEFHDYKNQKYDCGKMAVVGFLQQLFDQTTKRGMTEAATAIEAVAKQVKAGDFDEEADEEDQKMLAGLMSEMLGHRK